MTPAGRSGLLWALALGGCAAVEHGDAWRTAQVVAVGRASDLAGSVDRDCGTGASARYAVVRYRDGGVHSRSLGTGHWPAGVALKEGDVVYANILDCTAPLAMPDQSGRMSGAPPR